MHDAVAVYVSGCTADSNQLRDNLIQSRVPVAGVDILAYEARPQTEKGEGHLNIYHHIIFKVPSANGFHYMMGLNNDEGLQPHWPKDWEKSIEHYTKLGTPFTFTNETNPDDMSTPPPVLD